MCCWCCGDKGISLLINQLNCFVFALVCSVMTMMGTIDACLGVLADVLKILGMVSEALAFLCVCVCVSNTSWVCFNWSIVWHQCSIESEHVQGQGDSGMGFVLLYFQMIYAFAMCMDLVDFLTKHSRMVYSIVDNKKIYSLSPPSLPLQDSGLGDSPNKEVQILIPQPFMGTIIGTGGTKIKELRSVSVRENSGITS